MGSKRCQCCLIWGYLSGKWKVKLLYTLNGEARRMSEIEHRIPEANPRVLARQLRSLEKDGIVQRKIFAEMPPRVEYSLTEYGKTLMKLLKMINEFTIEHKDILNAYPDLSDSFYSPDNTDRSRLQE